MPTRPSFAAMLLTSLWICAGCDLADEELEIFMRAGEASDVGDDSEEGEAEEVYVPDEAFMDEEIVGVLIEHEEHTQGPGPRPPKPDPGPCRPGGFTSLLGSGEDPQSEDSPGKPCGAPGPLPVEKEMVASEPEGEEQ